MGLCVNWKRVAASVPGSSHKDANEDCQDRCYANTLYTIDNEPLLLLIAADGAGSAILGAKGANLAIKATITYLLNRCQSDSFELDGLLAIDCVNFVRRAIFDNAAMLGNTPRDLACTYLCVLVAQNETLIMQIGDGGIVIDLGDGYEMPIIPMSGEYANTTHFITDGDAIQRLETRVYRNTARKIAVFTDGIQRLAINFATNTVHEPFFKPFFQVMETVEAGPNKQLHNALITFLESKNVNERTYDDKTMALAVLVD